MRKFLKFLSQRIVIVTFLIFLQIMWFAGMFLKVTYYCQFITAAFNTEYFSSDIHYESK